MRRPALATSDDLENFLREHAAWRYDGTRLVLEATPSYVSACGLAAASVPLAEEIDHHPILTIGYNQLRVELWTHDQGGVTSLDFAMASFIDDFLRTRP